VRGRKRVMGEGRKRIDASSSVDGVEVLDCGSDSVFLC